MASQQEAVPYRLRAKFAVLRATLLLLDGQRALKSPVHHIALALLELFAFQYPRHLKYCAGHVHRHSTLLTPERSPTSGPNVMLVGLLLPFSPGGLITLVLPHFQATTICTVRLL